jgi:adenosine deaminase
LAGERGRRAFARDFPKAEIHLHLEGSVDLDTLVGLIQGRGVIVGPEERRNLGRLYSHRDFPHFLENFRDLCALLRRPEDFAAIASALSSRLRRDGVRYAEVFCSPAIFARTRGIPAAEILDAVSGAARAGERQGGPRLRFLLDGVRQFGLAQIEDLVRAAADCRPYDVIGIGMGGDESAAPTRVFAGPYREARRSGLRTTVHAGEFAGPRSVWEALEVLGAERIGHGIRAVEDPELVRVLRLTGVFLECCPTSNVMTGVVSRWEDHPIRALHREGVGITVNSDDPALFDTSVAGEWEALAERLGLAPEEVLTIGMRTVTAAFMPEPDKSVLLEAMRREAARTGVAP